MTAKMTGHFRNKRPIHGRFRISEVLQLDRASVYMGHAANTSQRRKIGKPVHLTPSLSPERRGGEPAGEEVIPAGEVYLKKEAVAKRLGVKPKTVSDWANVGKLPAYHVGRFLRFKWADVDQFITANCKVAAPRAISAGLATGATGNPAVAARLALPTNGGAQ